ncbi:2-hydroxyglutaryl-CoA dehydratase, D-component [Solimonas aquatica]|uniref:2-hydroxyglutaryl-CoA dehydratase, D-component n=1 Tax=Solimonas aquatica TaxID=489703 RepID=A0A1H9BD12_9GAMM|nr:2-hydroxyacyl-CoA dehydratase family protein [Solimonas aquatica]SEP86158.1 2-hydroxyglutaryl-CoA dehydratase, D-component [Solimonas aquatica]
MPAQAILAQFEAAAEGPLSWATEWKRTHGTRLLGTFPMHFPGEMAHAAGCLPLILQEQQDPITVGHGMIYPFYCGYTRSIVDQACKGEFEALDAIMFGDHCVQVLGAADVVRAKLPNTWVHFYQLISSMSDPWSLSRARETFAQLKAGIEEMTGQPLADDAIRSSIRLFNRNRDLLRQLYELRREGRIQFSARQMQLAVKSSMVMDKALHNELLKQLLAQLLSARPSTGSGVRVYLSGHFCQAPKTGILDLIEDCGGIVVDDDLYHGTRFISTDVDEVGDPLTALAQWYLARNLKVPCPTRVDQKADWETYLLGAMERAKAEGMIVLMAKFCEPHMYYYPEIKEAFERRGVPHLLIETEHELNMLEGLRTRVESFLEVVKRRAGAPTRRVA